MCSAFTPDCGYDNSTAIHIGDVYCRNTKCLGKVCLHKKTFQSLGRSNYQCPQCASVCQVRNLPFEEETISFFLSLGQGVYILEENPKSIQGVIGDVYCPGEHRLNRENCKSIGGFVTTPRCISGCDNFGACLFVHKVPFKIQEHVKTTKTDLTRFFFAKKRCYTTNNCSIKSHFNQPIIKRKNCLWITSRLLEMCIVRHVETKSVFTFLPIKRLVSTTAQNQRIRCLAVMEDIV